MEPPLSPASGSGEWPQDPQLSARSQFTGTRGPKGSKNHLSPARCAFPLGRGEPLYILVGRQGEDARPGVSGASGKGLLQRAEDG